MGTASEQFRSHVGLKGSPDSSLGLENAKGKSGGKPMTDDPDVDASHPTTPGNTHVVNTRPAKRKAAATKKRESAKAATTKAKADEKSGTAKKTAKKSTAKKK